MYDFLLEWLVIWLFGCFICIVFPLLFLSFMFWLIDL